MSETSAVLNPSNAASRAQLEATAPSAQHLARMGPLWHLLRPVRGYLISCTLLSALGAAAGLAPYIAIAEIARVALGTQHVVSPSGTIWAWVVGVVGASLRLVLVFSSSRLGHYADAEILHDIRVKLVQCLGILPIGWFKAVGSGAVKKVMTSDLEEMHQLIAHALGQTIGAATAIVVGIGYLSAVDWRMAAVTVAALGAWAFFFKAAMRSMSQSATRSSSARLTRRAGARRCRHYHYQASVASVRSA